MQNKDIIVICDEEVDYCYKLDEYLRANLNLPFEIYDFTDVASLKEFNKKENIAILVISSKAYKELDEKMCSNVLLLEDEDMTEQYVAEGEDFVHISKYVPSRIVLNNLLDVCMDIPGSIGLARTDGVNNIELIGSYTPLDKASQLFAAMEIGAKIAEKEKTLLIDMEPFSGMELYTKEHYHENLADLMYYLECNPDKFLLYFDRITQQYNDLKIIPPVVAPSLIQTITYDQWIKLIQEIAARTDIKKIILNVSESVNGLYDLLAKCSKIYSILGDDIISQNIYAQYEKMLKENEYENIIAATTGLKRPMYIANGETNQVAYKRWAKEFMD